MSHEAPQTLTPENEKVELAFRQDDGVEVRLLWDKDKDQLSVAVQDLRAEESFVLPAERDNGMDVFNHPYAYLRSGQLAVQAA